MRANAFRVICFGILGSAWCIVAAVAQTSTEAAYQFSIAKMLAGEGNVNGALTAFEQAVAAEPDDAYLRIEFAEFLYRIRRLDDAAEQAKVAKRLAPGSTDALRTYGQVQLGRAGENVAALREALEAFEELRRREPADVAGMLALGQIYSGLERFDEAADVYEELVSHHPDNRRLNRLLVEALGRAGREERAEEVLREILRLDDEALETRLRLAGLESERGNHGAAVDILRSAGPEIENDPRLRSLLAHELYRRALSPGVEQEQRNRDLDDALAVADGILSTSPEVVPLRLLRARILIEQRRGSDALEVLETLRREEPDDINVALQLAQAYERLDKVPEAVELLRRLSRTLSDDEGGTEVRLRLAGVYARNEDWRGVAESTGQLLDSEALDMDQDGLYQQVLALHVDALVRLERYDDALQRLRSLEKKSGPSAELLMRRAEILAAADRRKDALATLHRRELAEIDDPRVLVEKARLLLSLDEAAEAGELLAAYAAPGELEALLAVSQVYLFEEYYAEAVPYLDRLLERDDLADEIRSQVHFWAGMAHERTASYERAAAEFQAVLAIHPDDSGALNYLGYMWADQGMHLDQALELIEKAVALDPDNGAYVDSLGWAYFRLGNYELAQQHLERAVELVPDDPTILEHLGDVYVERGLLREARQAYERVLRINSEENVEQVRRKLGEL